MTERYGLLGRSLGHSFSKTFFESKFNALEIDATYENHEVNEASGIAQIIADTPGLRGLNVTVPFKTTVIAYLDSISTDAAEIGAVNCVRIADGRAEGYNTDHGGFLKSLRPFLTSAHHRALILGNGGAAAAVRYALTGMGVECLTVARAGRGVVRWADVNDRMMASFKLVIQCTPIGTWPNIGECPPIPYEAIGPEHLLFDMVYNPTESRFLTLGRARGASCVNGMDMLRFQAEASWEIWNR